MAGWECGGGGRGSGGGRSDSGGGESEGHNSINLESICE